MIVSKELAIKAGAGLATAAAGGTSIYYGVDYHQNKITIYDQALIKFLDDGGNINFNVTSGAASSGTELTNFPTTFDGNNKLTITVKVSTNDNGGIGTITNSSEANKKMGTKDALKKVNGETNNDWSWECKIVFDKGTSTSSDFETNIKDRIFKSTSEGLLGILKSGDATKKATKMDFIKKCAEHRGWSKNKEINTGQKVASREIKGDEVIFNLKDENNKFSFKEPGKFDYWFPKN